MNPAARSFTPRSERPARSSSLNHSFTFDSPNGLSPASAGPSTRKRTRGFATSFDGAADDEPIEKGGHSLRKRSRIDYTQELVDDDFLTQDTISGVSKKQTPAATIQSRKRRLTQDLSGDESGETSATQKRRRLEKEATGPHSISARRRNSRKPAADVPSFVKHPSSDNEVQDTILVSLADNQSEPQSSSEIEHPSSQADSSHSPVTGLNDTVPQQTDIQAPEAQDPTRQVEASITTHEDAVLGTTVSPAKTGHGPSDPKEETIFKEPQVITTNGHHRSGAEIQTVDQPIDSGLKVEDSAVPSDVIGLPESLAQPEASQANALSSPKQTVSDVGSFDFTRVDTQDHEALNSKSEQNEDDTASSISPATAESLQLHVPQPKRLPQLNSLYAVAEQQSYVGSLAPYDKEDIVHPASWTEPVYPQGNGLSTPAPTTTPLPTPPPREPVQFSQTWDGLKPLTYKEFFALYLEDLLHRRSRGQPRISPNEFRQACARRHKEALAKPVEVKVVVKTTKKGTKSKSKAKSKRALKTASPVEADSPVVAETQHPVLDTAEAEETPQGSPAPESQPVTAAPSPEPEVVAPDAAAEAGDNVNNAEQDIDADAGDSENERDGPVEPNYVTKFPAKQYSFKKLPDISVLEDALKDPEDADNADLYKKLESGAKTLQAWQEEYRELKKITDDEDNSKRRAQNDKAIENWDARQRFDDIPAWRRTFDDTVQKVPPPFDVKGVRAPKAYVDDPVQEHQREMDQVMAQAYGFEHKASKELIGNQDPVAQRLETSESRLRDRKQTQKAADLAEEGVILEGKRTRKPRVLGDQSDPVSRSSTPIPATRQRQRKVLAAPVIEEPQPEVVEEVPEPPTRKRAPRGKSKASSQEEATQQAEQALDRNGIDEQPVQEQSKVSRKRTRPAAPHPLATTTYAEPQEEAQTNEQPEPEPARKKSRKTKAATDGAEISAQSFYSQSATHDTQRESRPSTSSSSGTANTAATVESAYSLREKKKRNFAAENDPAAESRPKRTRPNPSTSEGKSEEPPKKRVRMKKKEHVADDNLLASLPSAASSGTPSLAPSPGLMMHTFSAHPDPTPAPAKKPPTKIKIINGHSGSAAAATATPVATPPAPIDTPPTNPASSNGSAEPEKPYSEMSKSEKMSYSMRRKSLIHPFPDKHECLLTRKETGRWAAGEMQGAVEKRKNTLARKAEAKATAPPPDLTPKPLKPAEAAAASPMVLPPASYPPHLGRDGKPTSWVTPDSFPPSSG
jgi:hypothetical protein